jgi:hypothetical protein
MVHALTLDGRTKSRSALCRYPSAVLIGQLDGLGHACRVRGLPTTATDGDRLNGCCGWDAQQLIMESGDMP